MNWLLSAAEERFHAGFAVTLVFLPFDHTTAEHQPADTKDAGAENQVVAHGTSITARFPLPNRCAILPVSAGAPTGRA
jgi:hypothetical protein